MNEKRLEWKVGVFVFLGLVVLAALMVNFTKGVAFFRPTYQIRLLIPNVGGIKSQAEVLLAGVPVGTVERVELAEDSKSVIIFLKIVSKYKIYGDAVFNIEAAGFLGDQYVAINPTDNAGPILKDGDETTCRESFNLQEAARSAVGLIQRVDSMVARVDEAVERINRTVLSEKTLGSFSNMVVHFQQASQRSAEMVDQLVSMGAKGGETLDQINGFLSTNGYAFGVTVTNLLRFTDKMTSVAESLEATVTTNRGNISSTMDNIRIVTEQATNLLAELNQGKGLVGALLHDEKISTDVQVLLSSLPTLTSNLNAATTNANMILSGAAEAMTGVQGFVADGQLLMSNGVVLVSNLNRHGIFFKPKPARTSPIKPLLTPRQKSFR